MTQSIRSNLLVETENWPELPLEHPNEPEFVGGPALDGWRDTRYALHMWMQVVGKFKLGLTPRVNHWWNVPFYLSAHGLTTAAIPAGNRTVEALFDFVNHELRIETSDGNGATLPLQTQSVADFYREFIERLHSLGIEASTPTNRSSLGTPPLTIWPVPVEVPDPIPFAEDTAVRAYNGDFARRFWRILSASERVFQQFRAGFIGKSSPVHFFWGSFDLAVTRFSGRRAPERPGADSITREAYSHECISAGWWPGTGMQEAAFYAYAAPEPAGFADSRVLPAEAFYDRNLSEFLLPYAELRRAATPEKALMEFLQSTYAAGAELGHWDRDALERAPDGRRESTPSEAA